LQLHSGENGKVTFKSFFEFFKEVTSLPEIVDVFNVISADQQTLTVRELYKFIQVIVLFVPWAMQIHLESMQVQQYFCASRTCRYILPFTFLKQRLNPLV